MRFANRLPKAIRIHLIYKIENVPFNSIPIQKFSKVYFKDIKTAETFPKFINFRCKICHFNASAPTNVSSRPYFSNTSIKHYG